MEYALPCTFTGHAREQMAERGISEQNVEHVLMHYTIRRPAGRRAGAKPAEILIGDIDGRQLKVWVERDSNPPRVKTAAWLDG